MDGMEIQTMHMQTITLLILSQLILVAMTTADTCYGSKEQSILNNIQSSLKLLEDTLKKDRLKCPGGWMEYKKHCYFFSKDSKTWFESERTCRRLGGYLVQITNSEENDWITNVMKSMGGRTSSFGVFEGSTSPWIGASDIGFGVGDYRWVNDLSKVKFSGWQPGQPDVNNEHCGQLSQGFLYKWNNGVCSQKIPFICERPLEGTCQPYVRIIKA